MFKIKNHDIYHIRGDTGILLLKPLIQEKKLDTGHYRATFSAKKRIRDDTETIRKEAVGDKIVFVPKDTAMLRPGDYVYDVEFQLLNDAGEVIQVSTYGPYKYHLIADVTRNCSITGAVEDTAELVLQVLNIARGEPGVSVVASQIRDDGHLIFTMSDNSTIDAGILPSAEIGRANEADIDSVFLD